MTTSNPPGRKRSSPLTHAHEDSQESNARVPQAITSPVGRATTLCSGRCLGLKMRTPIREGAVSIQVGERKPRQLAKGEPTSAELSYLSDLNHLIQEDACTLLGACLPSHFCLKESKDFSGCARTLRRASSNTPCT